MTVGILPGPEAVYPFDYVESAQSCFTSCNALALNDGVRAMVPGALADRYQPALRIVRISAVRLGWMSMDRSPNPRRLRMNSGITPW